MRITQGGGVPSWQRGAPSLCGVVPSLSSWGILPPLPKHPFMQTASKTVMISLMVSPSRRRAFREFNHDARARAFRLEVPAGSARRETSYMRLP